MVWILQSAKVGVQSGVEVFMCRGIVYWWKSGGDSSATFCVSCRTAPRTRGKRGIPEIGEEDMIEHNSTISYPIPGIKILRALATGP